jgi:all-trans-8'-apo-beta-carotenal 15,15'-oxygenase
MTGDAAPLALEVPAVWMWHALNAYVEGNRILADFVGYDAPDHFLGPDAAFRTIMQGRVGVARSSGLLRRFTMDLAAKRARLDTIAAGHFEFPMVHPGRVGQRHRFGYVDSGDVAALFQSAVARIDMERGDRREFSFGPQSYVGEPVFAPDPEADPQSPANEERGWLLCEVLDGRTERTSIVVLDAAHIEDGPVAEVRLGTHLPMSFHGWWQATAP